MSNKHVDPILAELLDAVSKPPRWVQQENLESQLIHFRPDSQEAQELLAALVASFERRFEKSSDVDHYAKYLAAAFHRVEQGMTVNDDDQDNAYEDWRARREP